MFAQQHRCRIVVWWIVIVVVRLSPVRRCCHGCSCCFFGCATCHRSVWSITRTRYYSPYPLTACFGSIDKIRLCIVCVCERAFMCVFVDNKRFDFQLNSTAANFVDERCVQIDFSDGCCDFVGGVCTLTEWQSVLCYHERSSSILINGTSAHKRAFNLTALMQRWVLFFCSLIYCTAVFDSVDPTNWLVVGFWAQAKIFSSRRYKGEKCTVQARVMD